MPTRQMTHCFPKLYASLGRRGEAGTQREGISWEGIHREGLGGDGKDGIGSSAVVK